MKNNLKNLSIFSLSLLLLISCSGVKNDVSFFIYNENDTFVSSLMNQVHTDLKQANKSFDISYASLSQATQNEQLAQAIENKSSKVLAVNIVDRLSASSIITKADAASLPILFFNRAPLEEDLLAGKNAYYVGTDPTYEGEAQADLAAELFGLPSSLAKAYDKNGDGIIQLVILKGEQGHQDTELRSRYCVTELYNLGYDVDIIASAYANWTKEEGYEAMKDIYEKYSSQIELVFSNNDDMAVGALNYLVDKHVFAKGADVASQPFPVIGVDATNIGISYIKDGLLYGTVKNDATAQAKAIAEFISYLSEGKKIDESFPYYGQMSDGRTVSVKGIVITKKDVVE